MGQSQSVTVPGDTTAVKVPAWSGVSASSSHRFGASFVRNSLMVDRSSFLEQFLTCLICTENFNTKERCPKRLPCNHTFCLSCLIVIHDQAEFAEIRTFTRSKNMACPICRQKVSISKQDLKTLPSDHCVVHLLDFFTQADAQARLQTANNVNEVRLAASGSQDTKETENQTMTVMDQCLLDVVQNTCSNILGEAMASSRTLTQSLISLGELQRQLHLRIRYIFTEYQDMLKQREQFLCREVTRHVNDRKNIIRERMERTSEYTKWLQRLHDEITSAQQCRSFRRSLWDLTDEMKQRQNAFKQESATDDSLLSQCCRFVAQNEGAFFSDLSDLGKIEAEVVAVARNHSASCVGIGLRVETDQHQYVQECRSTSRGLGAEDSENHRPQQTTDDDTDDEYVDGLGSCDSLQVTHLESSSERAESLEDVLLPSDNSLDRGRTLRSSFLSFFPGQSPQN